VERLPPEILRHYKQYSFNPRNWYLVGDDQGSHAFLKRLTEGSKSYSYFQNMLGMLDGTDIRFSDVYAVHNMILLNGFATKHVSLTSQVTTNPGEFMKDNWKEKDDPTGVRAWTRDRYDHWVERFNWNTNIKVKIVPAVHGTNEDVAYSIIKTGFVALSKLDSGFYGKGIYFTTSVLYALPYFSTKKSPAVIICLVISGNAYPVIEHPQKSPQSFLGAALVPGYHSHYILTRRNGDPCSEVMSGETGDGFYDELVIEQEAAILPFYFIKIAKEKLLRLINSLSQDEIRAQSNEEIIISDSIIRSEDNNEPVIEKDRLLPKRKKVKVEEEEMAVFEDSSSSSEPDYIRNH